MVDIDSPFGLPLPFAWNPDLHDRFIASDKSGWLADLYVGHRDLVMPSSAPEGFDGIVATPRFGLMPESRLRELVNTYLWALTNSLGPSWEVFDATKDTCKQEREFAGAFHGLSGRTLEFMAVQLARRNYQHVRIADAGAWREDETFIDPFTAMVAIYQVLASNDSRTIPPLHIFTPGLRYQVKGGGFNDVTRIDVEPPYVEPNGHSRPGLITLDWNWYHPNRARLNYNIGTLRPVSL